MVAISRMLHIVPLLVGITALPVGAQGVFKCVDGEATAYQSAPCASGQVQLRLAIAQPTRAEMEPVSATARAPSSVPSSAPVRSNTWPWRRTLTLGMSDDEVLNLPGWGIPTRIIRARVPRQWREEWIYTRSPTEERRLQFVNATLVDIVDSPLPPEMVASASLRQ